MSPAPRIAHWPRCRFSVGDSVHDLTGRIGVVVEEIGSFNPLSYPTGPNGQYRLRVRFGTLTETLHPFDIVHNS